MLSAPLHSLPKNQAVGSVQLIQAGVTDPFFSGASLLRRLWASNSCDVMYVLDRLTLLPRVAHSTCSIDFSLTVTSVALNYAGPFFLK